ncbi:hypothetical protein BURK2_03046 [Burkholderiales bacterium]|nr:hypothetical protein BURK2_03046 [Burkholderiales bacterium]
MTVEARQTRAGRRTVSSSSDVLDVINDLERRFPVQRWRAGDIDLWPVYRVRVYMNVTQALLSSQPTTPSYMVRRARIARRMLRALWRPRLDAWRDRGMQADLTARAGAVCLSDGISFTLLDTKWYDRVMDPVIHALGERGIQTLKLTPNVETLVPRAVPSRFIQPDIDRELLLAARDPIKPDLPSFDEFRAAAREHFGEHVQPGEWLDMQAKRLNSLANWFGTILASTLPRMALVNNYYSIEGFAFVQAAHRAGVPSADLQHGLQGPLHGAYGRWSDVPAEGYSTLPDEFWVWTDEEAQAIDSWRGSRQRHIPRITGNLWRERWFDDGDPLVSHYLLRAREARGPDGTIQALVSLSWGLADEETDKLIRAAKRCGPSVSWWWRLHPVEAKNWKLFAARLESEGLDPKTVQAATELPLYAIVRSADVTLAHSSTVMQEAAVFGVPSVITSDYGVELHANLLESGMALLATTDDAIARAVSELGRRPRRVAGGEPRPNGLSQAVDRWLTAGATRRGS